MRELDGIFLRPRGPAPVPSHLDVARTEVEPRRPSIIPPMLTHTPNHQPHL